MRTVEQLIKIMRKNDMPKAKILFVKDYLAKLAKEGLSFDHISSMERNFRLIQKIYCSIDWKDQDEETGKKILLTMKKLIDEFSLLFEAILTSAKPSPSQPHQIPSRAFEILDEMIHQSELYGSLSSYRIYRACIIDYGGMTRAEWFLQGKPAVERYDYSRGR